MKKLLVVLSALMLLASPVIAQEMPIEGTVVVIAGIYDGTTWIPVQGEIIIPPLACDPS